ncbi:MAG: flavodoxin domain-containing protein [Patulibacter sp.]
MTDRRVLVLYASNYGQTRKVALRIADRLREAPADVEVSAIGESPDATAYDLVVVGGSIHAGNHQRALERWMRSHAGALNARPTAVFSVSLSATDEDGDGRVTATKYLTELLSRTGVETDRTAVIAGALAYRDYNPLIRWMMRRLARRKGLPDDTSHNVELTDWDAVDRFGAELVEGFGLRSAP